MLYWGLFPKLTIEVVPQGPYNNDILKRGKHISDGGTTTYNNNIRQNIF